jgi:hypothetical protein
MLALSVSSSVEQGLICVSCKKIYAKPGCLGGTQKRGGGESSFSGTLRHLLTPTTKGTIMTKQLKLMGRCLSVLVLLGLPCGKLLAQSTISADLYENTVSVDTVAIVAGPRAIASVGGIYLDGSVLRGSASATTLSVGNVAVAVGSDASSRLGGITMKNASVNGALNDRTAVSDSIALAVKGDASVGGILVQNARFNGSVSSTTAVSDRLALSLGGFSLFFFVPSHIGGVRITN